MKVSESEATDVYKAALRVMSTDGTIARGLQEKMIALQRRSLKVERDVLPEQVYDFTIVRAINDELRKIADLGPITILDPSLSKVHPSIETDHSNSPMHLSSLT